ncbi:MAG: hypothetical protein GY696_31150 [Gammaproteobacteria bacterium]|nr:hypothetical protein [Gammaproteobacteria bacterium]
MSDLVFEDNIYLTASSAVFGILRAESGSLSTFTGHRIAEVRAATEEACMYMYVSIFPLFTSF